ncbi:MAG: hypothetical protein WD448_11825 [Woeseia sp.]
MPLGPITLGTINISRRFRGPPNSANGGYACGRLAAFIQGPAEVTLRSPPPLERELSVVRDDGEGVALCDGDLVIATARPQATPVEDAQAPSFEEAVAASGRSFEPSHHKLPMCYVCGPDREPGDGLRLFCGPLEAEDLDWNGTVAAPFVPEPYMAGSDGDVSPEFVWAALDCPTAYAAGSPAGFPTILLGRQAVTILRRPKIAEKCIVTARQTAKDGRKYHSQAALFGADGRPIAQCKTTWIEVHRTVQLGKQGQPSS